MQEEAKEKKTIAPIFYQSSCIEGGPENRLSFRRGDAAAESSQAGGGISDT